MITTEYSSPHRRHLYFEAVVGLGWSNDRQSYAGGSVASGKASHPDRSKVIIQILVLRFGGLDVGLTTYLVKI
jgi:hypothetical protein